MFTNLRRLVYSSKSHLLYDSHLTREDLLLIFRAWNQRQLQYVDPQIKIEQIPETQTEMGEEEHSKAYLRKQPMVLFKNCKIDVYFQ